MRVLVTGGAGYIGSHCVKQLIRAGHVPVVLDNLVYGHRSAVRNAEMIEADLSDVARLERILRDTRSEAVIHFAAYAYVGESVHKPLKYYDNNVCGTVNLLRALVRAGIKLIVFSSTCAVYGVPERIPLQENCARQPVSPYGKSKYMVEQVLEDCVRAEGLGAIALRYFNVAGADVEGELGEDHRPETHLIPLAVFAALGRDPLSLYGTDYPTPDGTCIRDYIHVDDLARAHVSALDRVEPGEFVTLNLGIGKGFSVREVIASTERVTGRKVPVQISPRRAGDPPALYADAQAAAKQLNWRPQITEIDDIVRSAYRWFQQNPMGYKD